MAVNMISIGINGLGRIGRLFLRQALGRSNAIKIKSLNSPGSIESLAHLIKYDSIHGRFKDSVEILSPSQIKIGSHTLSYSREKQPENLSWEGVDLVLESSGVFKKKEDLKKHLKNVKKVLVAAPAQGADWTVVYGINHKDYDPKSHSYYQQRILHDKLSGPYGLCDGSKF